MEGGVGDTLAQTPYYFYTMRLCMSSILLPKASVILFLASFSSKDKAEIHFEERDGITSHPHHLITLEYL